MAAAAVKAAAAQAASKRRIRKICGGKSPVSIDVKIG